MPIPTDRGMNLAKSHAGVEFGALGFWAGFSVLEHVACRQ